MEDFGTGSLELSHDGELVELIGILLPGLDLEPHTALSGQSERIQAPAHRVKSVDEGPINVGIITRGHVDQLHRLAGDTFRFDPDRPIKFVRSDQDRLEPRPIGRENPRRLRGVLCDEPLQLTDLVQDPDLVHRPGDQTARRTARILTTSPTPITRNHGRTTQPRCDCATAVAEMDP